MSRLEELLQSSVKLSEVVADVTEKKDPASFDAKYVSNAADFSQQPLNYNAGKEKETEEKEEEQEDYDAKANARALIGGLVGVDTMIFSIVAVLKAKKSVGGKETITKMKLAYVKKANGQTLTEEEESQLQAFEMYKKDVEMMEADFIPNEKRMKMLIDLAEPWCEQSKVKVTHSMAFWANYVGFTVERVAKILMK